MTTLDQQPSVRLQRLMDDQQQSLLCSGLKGIEKESLRIATNGMIAQTPHPIALGSALTHPSITTDYSEALLEFITPPLRDARDTLASMHNIHQFVYTQLKQELLLNTSMPCGLNGDLSIPIAQYGPSNIGKMKHIYRRGLWHRYGRSMQAIAGIHFNYSIPEALWPVLYAQEQTTLDLQQFINEAYFGLVRNFQRISWLVLYLFGASPAICKSFFGSRPELMAQFAEFDAHTLYHPYATSLRMSDIGYKSKNQENLNIDYNSLAGYVATLGQAISTPYPEYEKIGVKVNNDYLQLNSNILQIENEFYSTMRPKQIINSGEKPTLALKRRGVRYVEMRALDLNLYNPIGIDLSTAYFLEAFLLTCLLQESPKHNGNEVAVNNANQLSVAHNGRQPGLALTQNGATVPLQTWAQQILQDMRPVCRILDAEQLDQPYSQALALQQAKVDNPDLTPSAQILAEMRRLGQSFGTYALNKSAEHQQYFNKRTLDETVKAEFSALAEASLAKQRCIETNDKVSFDEFLVNYFAQS
ncbi:MAG: glutamate--cysteine ligase [Methylococcaceae bacterium]|nr:glutamate--cysteine ligase [Methylococcaceae bacterium]